MSNRIKSDITYGSVYLGLVLYIHVHGSIRILKTLEISGLLSDIDLLQHVVLKAVTFHNGCH